MLYATIFSQHVYVWWWQQLSTLVRYTGTIQWHACPLQCSMHVHNRDIEPCVPSMGVVHLHACMKSISTCMSWRHACKAWGSTQMCLMEHMHKKTCMIRPRDTKKCVGMLGMLQASSTHLHICVCICFVYTSFLLALYISCHKRGVCVSLWTLVYVCVVHMSIYSTMICMQSAKEQVQDCNQCSTKHLWKIWCNGTFVCINRS